MLEGLRGEESIAELCRREGIASSMYYGWSKEFLEAGKRRLAGDTARAATSDEVKDLRREAQALKEIVADLTLENRLLKKSMIGRMEDEAQICASDKAEIIRLVEQSHLPARRTLEKLGIPRSSFYRWYDRYQRGGPEGLADRSSRPDRVWNRIPEAIRSQIVDLALDQPELRRDKAVAGSCASSHGVLEFRSLLGSAGRIPGAVGMRAACSGELAAVDDEIFITDRSALEPAFENLACSRCVPRLRRKRSSGDVGRHAMVRHGPPRMDILRRWLGEPQTSPA